MQITITPVGLDTARSLLAAYTNAENRFHKAFIECRYEIVETNQKWLKGDPCSAKRVAYSILKLLREWGANRRGNQHLGEVDDMTPHLLTRDFRNNMALLQKHSLVDFPSEPLFKEVLEHLCFKVLAKPKTVLYPTKALMLLWPHICAVDDNVRRGLNCIPGLQNLQTGIVDASINSRSLRKLYMLHKNLLAEMWKTYGDALLRAIPKEQNCALEKCPGRVLDMYLFSLGLPRTDCVVGDIRKNWWK